MTPEQSAQLRAEFPPSQVHQIQRRNKKTGTVAYLDYVGHAEVTDRLLKVDPEWTWEPMATEPNGMPVLICTESGQPIGLWIRLTICGVTRVGFGSVEPDVFEAEKQLISDAIRNVAMRFGVALDLWSRSDLHEAASDDQERAPRPSPAAQRVQQAIQETRLPEPEELGKAGCWKELLVALPKSGLGRNDILPFIGGEWLEIPVNKYLTDNSLSIAVVLAAAREAKG